MLDAKQAITKGLEFSAALSSSLLPTQNVLLEGIEATDDDKWLVTHIFALPDNPEIDDILKELGSFGALNGWNGSGNFSGFTDNSVWMGRMERFFP